MFQHVPSHDLRIVACRSREEFVDDHEGSAPPLLHHRCESYKLFLKFTASGLNTFLYGKVRLNIREEMNVRGLSRNIESHLCQVNELSEASCKGSLSALIRTGQYEELLTGFISEIIRNDFFVLGPVGKRKGHIV